MAKYLGKNCEKLRNKTGKNAKKSTQNNENAERE